MTLTLQSLEENARRLVQASAKGAIEDVRLLLPVVSDTKKGNSYAYALRQAAYNGHADILELLIPLSDPKANNSEALRWAAQWGHTDCVILLLPVSDPKANNSEALRRAASKGHAECVKRLIPVCDPKALDSHALMLAASNGHTECTQQLIPFSDYQFVLEMMLADNYDTTLLQQCIDEYEALQQKEYLTTHLQKNFKSNPAPSSLKRKI